MPYDPPREANPKPPRNPLEIDLVYNVRPCGTCGFFWPENPAAQPYGPYSSYDFNSNTPAEKAAEGATGSFVWTQATTRTPSFPDAEVMDGCRKAPIMTIGINPNLTAFAPGQTGASWCYPSFSSDAGTDSWTKYAYYYRYRSVYQEHLDLKFAERFLLPDGQIKAAKAGTMVDFARLDDKPAFDIRVQYDGDPSPTAIHLPGTLGAAPYVVLFDAQTHFAAGAVLAARISVPAARKVAIYDQPIGYYTQMLPVLQDFEAFLKTKGHAGAKLQVGEDVGQLDMVACASPHWGKQWLGDTSQSVNTVMSNCVHKNAWALKQLIHTQPAVLFLVGQSSWDMFYKAFANLIQGPPAIKAVPEDGPYTLLRLTTQQECRIEFATTIDGQPYKLSTRLVITPHFSYNVNFEPQFRISPDAYKSFGLKFPPLVAFLESDARIQVQKTPGTFVAVGIVKDAPAVLAEIKTKFAAAEPELMAVYYDPHAMMSGVLAALYEKGELAYGNGVLTRSAGPCTFCDNSHWKFPKGCPYDKPAEQQYPLGFLEKVTKAITG